MDEILFIIAIFMVNLLSAKMLFVGSDYYLHYRIKYGKLYNDWYNKRKEFDDYLRETEDIKLMGIYRRLYPQYTLDYLEKKYMKKIRKIKKYV